jgi:hypothetical protein
MCGSGEGRSMPRGAREAVSRAWAGQHAQPDPKAPAGSEHPVASLGVRDETIRDIRSERSRRAGPHGTRRRPPAPPRQVGPTGGDRGQAVCGQLPWYSAIDQLGCGNGHRKRS